MASHFPTKSLAFEAWSLWWEVISSQKDQPAVGALTFLIAVLAISCFYLVMPGKGKRGRLSLPPGPPGLPLVGNLPFLDPQLHFQLVELSRKYGPVIKLRLGRKTWVVASSPSTAKEILKDHDVIFANRTLATIAPTISYGVKDIIFSPYGPTWRMLRKICAMKMMGKASLDALCELRRCEVQRTISYINTKAETSVNIGDQMFMTMLNLILNMLWGGMLKGEERSSVGAKFRKAVSELSEIFSKPNISDFFPILARFDLQGVERRTKEQMVWFDTVFDSIINQRLSKDITGTEGHGKDKECNDFLQILLQLEEGDPKTPLTLSHIKALLFDIVAAGTETTSASLEWAMAELMEHPEIMRKAQKELEEVVGLNNVVEEFHLPKLHYLNAVLKEVHRLYPVVPLLLPRCPSESCAVGGYKIPKGSQVMVNAWAIHRDPMIWDNPLEFQPQRFFKVTDDKWDYSGNDYRYLPFGSGRRICVGVPMAERMLPYTLASLIHSFDWSLPEGTKLNLVEKFGIVLKKAIPLVIVPCPRLSNPELYS
eukprot:TRINITY_DN3276_c0_g1_i1.p1 TRINITY_DN3276_c0_g1~~TRINITY_DN3276_c0_g1_i1.p1  ORF type:complete len:540 (+),score=47.07 TRINITY_DN3276_c0_g1_i1:70-1689(+)